MAIQLKSQWIQQFSDFNGLLVGGLVYFYEAGSTTTKKAIYTSAAGTTQLGNPQTLGSLGEIQNVIYLDGDYNLVITDSNGVTKFQRDNFDATTEVRSVEDWMLEAQLAGCVIGGWSLVKAETGVTLVAGDIVFGDADGALYQLTGDSDQDPEADTYNVNTGVGAEWIKLSISNAPITQSNLDTLQAEIDNIQAAIDNQGYFNGLKISNGADTEHDITTTAGTAQDSTGLYRMTAATSYTKAIDATWAEGTAQGGLPNGVPLNSDTKYYYFIIGKTTDVNDIDFGFDVVSNATNLLNISNAGAQDYNIYRQIGWAITDGSANIINFTEKDDWYYWNTRIVNRSAADVTTGTFNTALTAPPNTLAMFTAFLNCGGASGHESYVIFSDTANIPATATISNSDMVGQLLIGTYENYASGNFTRIVDSSSEVGTRVTQSTASNYDQMAISTIGYYFKP